MQIARRLPFPSESSANKFTDHKQVFTQISSFVRGSNVYRRGRSFAASVPSDIPNVQKGRKRVPKDERRAMVEAFVNNYRAINAGKFPTVSDAQKQVGGSYYVIREILQELQYKSKISSMNTRNENVLAKEVAQVNEASTNVENVSSIRPRMDAEINTDAQTAAGNDLDISDSSLKNVGAEDGPEISTLFKKTLSEAETLSEVEDDCSSYVEKRSHMSNGEAEVVFHRSPERQEHDVKDTAPSEGLLDLDGPKHKYKQHQESPELDKFVMDLSEKQTDVQELPKKSSMWENLKSLADGIVNLWKKL